MKNLILTLCALLLSISIIQAQENKKTVDNSSNKEKLHIKIKDGAKPDIYVDGKKFDFPMDILDSDMIESVSVVKGDKALKEYNSKNGVVLIVTKKKNAEIDNASANNEGKAPMIIINGKNSDRKTLEKLSPDDIESIEVFKDERALKKYNATNGVIVVTTKKEKKK
ncbi:hypothetical protein LY01_01019 [Nonlabens xylanidelens]|uniref:TonB-dependent receptor-like protein n=1 Tax=Nonlabens xylanidelens TaxID=191564 RepID=A0A2S6IME6_9FLAO|nr:hypothetical protein [Nonlabens xylanidelens]PPK95432.1 hypothetical protein LY01_01019 [Nonlabens xylanidelens]PQJ22253.1 hypothetical protein BST94_01355 [Nonlabens xylanidelens]